MLKRNDLALLCVTSYLRHIYSAYVVKRTYKFGNLSPYTAFIFEHVAVAALFKRVIMMYYVVFKTPTVSVTHRSENIPALL